MKSVLKSLIVWLMIIPLAVLNGALREKLLAPHLEEPAALIISGIILCFLILMLTIFVLPRFARSHYVAIGITWAVCTIIFECIMIGATGGTFRQMFDAYDITTGNLWLLVVVFAGFAPWLGAKLRS